MPTDAGARIPLGANEAISLTLLSLTRELGTPLAVIHAAARLAPEVAPSCQEVLFAAIERQSALARLLVESMVPTGSPDPLTVTAERVDLDLVARQTIDDLGLAPLAHHPVTLHAAERCEVHADPTATRQILSALLATAVRAHPPHTRLTLTVDGDGAWGTCRLDPASGPIGPDDLGLHLARRLATAQGGSLRLATSHAGVAELRLPRDAGSDAEAAATDRTPSTAARTDREAEAGGASAREVGVDG